MRKFLKKLDGQSGYSMLELVATLGVLAHDNAY